MPISAPANKPALKPALGEAGFTLIEALMALLIVGLLAGAVALSAPAPDARARSAAQTLAARMTLAGDESVMRNRTVGLMMTDAGYGFATLEAEGWQPVDGPTPLSFRVWPAGVSGRVVQTSGIAGGVDRGDILARFDVMGAATPLRVRVDGGAGAWIVALDAGGGAHVQRDR